MTHDSVSLATLGCSASMLFQVPTSFVLLEGRWVSVISIPFLFSRDAEVSDGE